MSRNDKAKYVGGMLMEKIQRVIEVERITNLVRGFGWEVVDTKAEGDTMRMTIEKKVETLVSTSP